MNEFAERQFESLRKSLGFRSLDEQLSSHGLETQETLRLRNEIKKFFESHYPDISQNLGTEKFSVMVGGSLQVGTADSHSDVDLTIILDGGDTGEIWVKGGIGETQEGIRGLFLFRPDSLKQQLQRDVEVNLISLENLLMELENLESLESKEDKIIIVDDVIRIFSPQLYEAANIDDFRRSIIQMLASIPIGEKFWNQEIVPQLRTILIERIGDEKGESWPERERRGSIESQQKNDLSKRIANRLSNIEIPNFQEMRGLYGI